MMKQIRLVLLCISFCSFAFAQKNIYVATNGNDSNDGSMASPFKTFQKAVSIMSAGDVCVIRGGTYEEQLIVNKNGTVSKPITFKAADGELVDLRATSKVNGWQLHSGKIYKANVSTGIPSRFRALYHNEVYMDLARWPNNTDNDRWTVDCTPVKSGDGSHFVINTMPNIDWTGGLVYYLGAHSGTSWTRPVTSNTTTRINYESVNLEKWPFSNHNPNRVEGSPDNRRGQLFLFNKLEALDHAREWYYDQTNSTLYFQTADGTKPMDGSVEFAKHQYAVRIKGDHIKLEGLNVFGGSIYIENRADNNQILNCTIIHGNEGHDSLTNTGAQVGEAAIQILGDRTLVKGCTIDQCSVNGITIAGWAADDCIIEGNTISNMDYVGIHASPIRTSGDRMKILKNTIFNAGRDGMYVAGIDSEVAYNDVSASQKINSDSGIFYTVGNKNLKNNEIHHNWFHDATAPAYSHNPDKPAKAAGIYLDNDSKGYSVHHNVIWNVSWSGYQVNWNNVELNFYHNTIWNAERAMDSWDINGPQPNNKIYNNYANTGSWHKGKGPSEFDIKDSPIFATSPFVDADAQNFMPAAGSALVDKAPIIPRFDKKFKGSSPDIGAYELGGTMWTAGVNAIEDTGERIIPEIFDINFTISSTSETCPNQDNGQLKIVADITDSFEAVFNGTKTSFSKETIIENIAPGSYELCITVKDDTSGKNQCYNVEIKEAVALASKTLLDSDKLSIEIDQGTAPYSVTVNDEVVLITNEDSFSVTVHEGDIVNVSTSKACEGKIIEKIDLFGEIQAYPNPTQGAFQLLVPVSEGKVVIELYDINAKLISSNLYHIAAGTIDLNLNDQPSGIYFAKILSKNPKNVEIVKQ